MRKYLLIILPLIVSLFFNGCNKIDELTYFDIDYNFIFTLPAIGFGSIDIESNEVENNTENSFENNDSRKELVERATLKKFEVTILEPINGSFNFVNSVEVYAKTTILSEKLIAWKYDVPQTIGSFIKLETTNDDLKKYLTSDKIKVRLKTTANSTITEDHKMDLFASVEVDAKILGI